METLLYRIIQTDSGPLNSREKYENQQTVELFEAKLSCIVSSSFWWLCGLMVSF